MPIHLVTCIVVRVVHATSLRFAYTARINKQSSTIVQTYYTVVPTFILYCSRSFSAVVFVLVLHLSFVISNYIETFGGYHLPPVAYSTSSTRCPLHRCLASANITQSNYTIFGNTNFHRSFTSFVHISHTIVQDRLKQSFSALFIQRLHDTTSSAESGSGTIHPFKPILCPLCVLYK